MTTDFADDTDVEHSGDREIRVIREIRGQNALDDELGLTWPRVNPRRCRLAQRAAAAAMEKAQERCP